MYPDASVYTGYVVCGKPLKYGFTMIQLLMHSRQKHKQTETIRLRFSSQSYSSSIALSAQLQLPASPPPLVLATTAYSHLCMANCLGQTFDMFIIVLVQEIDVLVIT